MRRVIKIFTFYNLANVILGFAFELLRAYSGAKVFNFVMDVLFFLISAFSYLSPIALIFSVFAVIYCMIAIFRANKKYDAYMILFVNMINLIGLGYFMLIALSEV